MRETLGRLLRNLADRLAGSDPASASHPGAQPSGSQTPADVQGLFAPLVAGVRDYAIFRLDADGHVRSWNAGAERIKGYRADEILGRHFSRFYDEESIKAGKPESELRGPGDWTVRGGRLAKRKDGSRFWANVLITALRDQDGTINGYLKITQDLTERKESEERLRQANANLESRVEERTAELASTNRQLAAANSRLQSEVIERQHAEEALKEADRRKNEFIAMMSHELRNPLACLRNALLLMELQGEDGDGAGETHAMMERQVEQLTGIVDDLLDVSRIVRGRFELRKSRVAFGDLIGRAVDAIRAVIDSHGHELDISLPPEPLFVEGDSTRLVQVLTNLLENAALYQKGPGKIWLSARREGDRVVVRVRDAGMGIEPSLLPHVFETFVQDERPLARTQGGMGIGLTLVRRLVELHGGTVTAESEGRGRGSEFVVRLPALDSPAGDGNEAVQESQPPGPVPPHSRVSVLVVDDNVDAALTLAALLNKLGYDSQTAFDGPSALDAARSARPVGHPPRHRTAGDGRIRGGEARCAPNRSSVMSRWLRSPATVRTRIAHRAREAGFDRHFTKPVDVAAVRDFLAAAAPTS